MAQLGNPSSGKILTSAPLFAEPHFGPLKMSSVDKSFTAIYASVPEAFPRVC